MGALAIDQEAGQAFIEARKDLQMEVATARKILLAYQDRMARLLDRMAVLASAPDEQSRLDADSLVAVAGTIAAAAHERMESCVAPIVASHRTMAMPEGGDALLTGWGESFYALIAIEYAALTASLNAIDQTLTWIGEIRSAVDPARPPEAFRVIEGGYDSSSAERTASQPARSEVQISPPRITVGR